MNLIRVLWSSIGKPTRGGQFRHGGRSLNIDQQFIDNIIAEKANDAEIEFEEISALGQGEEWYAMSWAKR
jgi:hypothetical protein